MEDYCKNMHAACGIGMILTSLQSEFFFKVGYSIKLDIRIYNTTACFNN
jgi:hypothetical protein